MWVAPRALGSVLVAGLLLGAPAGCGGRWRPQWRTTDPRLTVHRPDGSLPRLCIRLAVCGTRWAGCVLAERSAASAVPGAPDFRIVSGPSRGRQAVASRFAPPGIVSFEYEWLNLDERPADGCERARAECRRAPAGSDCPGPWLRPRFSCRPSGDGCLQVPLDRRRTL